MPQYNFSMPLADFDPSLLPAGGPAKGSPGFAAAVHRYLEGQFSGFGGTAQIAVDPKTISIMWDAQPGTTPLEAAMAKLAAGELVPAVTMLQLLLRERPGDANLLYNIGMALSDLGRLTDAQAHLRRLLEIDPLHANAQVALGVAFARQGKLEQAVKHLRKASELEPRNPWAQRNLGACLAKLGQATEAIECFTRAAKENPRDQQSHYGLAEALRQQGKAAEADAAYREVLRIDEHAEVAEQARKGLTLLARKGFEEGAGGGVRPDAVMYCLGALKKFADMDKPEIQKIAFEIALLGRSGLKVNEPEHNTTCNPCLAPSAGCI